MATDKSSLAVTELERRAKPWHALAALAGSATSRAHQLFTASDEPEGSEPAADTAGLRVQGQVPIDCLRVADVMD